MNGNDDIYVDESKESYLSTLSFIMWSDEDWDVASLVPKTPTHLPLEVRFGPICMLM